MHHHASGRFDVRMDQQSVHDAAAGTGMSRMSLDKRYHGALDATGTGEMLAAMTATPGSAAYVAIEQVDGALDGRRGRFLLQHAGTMDRGAPTLAVLVVPDSGTGELVGLTGRLDIRIEDGQHFYAFDYVLD